jgi:hypothetical protein
MCITFTAADVKKWADFSGDYNPIHFDPDRARLAGAEGPIVHGMLALLPVKQAVSDKLLMRSPNEVWLRFKALFQRPVPQDRSQSIVLTQKSLESLKFRVESEGDKRKHCHGSASLVARPEVVGIANRAKLQTVPLEAVAEDFASFLIDFPSVRSPWIWLDALVFSNFVKYHLPEMMAKTIGHAYQIAPTVDAFSEALLVQTSQETFVSSARAFDLPLDSATIRHANQLRYGVTRGPVIATESGLCCSVQVCAEAADQIVLLSEHGLLLKRDMSANIPTDLEVNYEYR